MSAKHAETNVIEFAVKPKISGLPTVDKIFGALEIHCGLTPRESQLELARIVNSTLAANGVCCVEAPTGTGKTFGYLAGALEHQAHSGENLPIVVATATVGLQEQIIREDIPRLEQIGAIEASKVAIAKGRNRYFCPRTAAMLEDKKNRDTQEELFDTGKYVAEGGVEIALTMLSAWRAGDWNGEQDSWEGQIPDCWGSTCGASSETCVNRACEHYVTCPYMNSRKKLAMAKVIVANHDFVLADLAQRAEDQEFSCLPGKRYALIVDEAHNLPEKAIRTLESKANLAIEFSDVDEYNSRVLAYPVVLGVLKRKCSDPNILSNQMPLLGAGLKDLNSYLAKHGKFNLGGLHDWGLRTPAEATLAKVRLLRDQSSVLLIALQEIAKVLVEMADQEVGMAKGSIVRLLADTHKRVRQMAELHRGLAVFSSSQDLVRWAARSAEGKVTLHAQPLEGRDVLTELLWKLEMPVALVSATLQISGSFDRFAAKSGLPSHALTKVLPPVFDYSRGYLHFPEMACAPGTPGFDAEVSHILSELFAANTSKGMLVLFTAKKSLRAVAPSLQLSIDGAVHIQGTSPVPELVQQHKAAIDSGKRSMLVGLSSMAEGLDLPGQYCGHVVIVRLPFAVPGDPVEAARKEKLGRDWFDKAYLADMLTTLIQSTGRLIRREDDHGVITILDKRLLEKRYASTAIEALPRFTIIHNKLSKYFEHAKDRGFDWSHKVAKKAKAVLSLVQ